VSVRRRLALRTNGEAVTACADLVLVFFMHEIYGYGSAEGAIVIMYELIMPELKDQRAEKMRRLESCM
jgi:hypothetical protein